jgi:hypothetical protein
VKFEKLALRAKKMVDQRGGIESLKADAAQLKDIAKGEGTMSEKAKAAAQAIKTPGADDAADAAPAHQDVAPAAQDATPAAAAPAEPAPADPAPADPAPADPAPADPAPAAPTTSPDLAAWAAGDDSAAQQ